MLSKARSRPDLLLVISLVFVILVHPSLDHGDFRRFFLGAVMFVPVIIATIRLAETKSWQWPAVLLMLGVLGFTIASNITANAIIAAIKWGLLAAFFAVTVVRLFSYLRKARAVVEAHIATAISIYLLLGMFWFALYSGIDTLIPGSISHSTAGQANRASELLYFSFITLATMGYGDVVPLQGEVRMLAALEGVVGILYVAITIALLVSAYKNPYRGE